MKRAILTATLAGSCIGLVACGYDEGEYNNAAYDEANASYDAANATYDANAAGGAAYGGNAAAAAGAWPEGARIVVEDGVTYRIDPGGARVRLGEADSRIVVEDNVRFRVDPDGTRVRIDDEGAVIDVDTGEVDAGVTVNTE